MRYLITHFNNLFIRLDEIQKFIKTIELQKRLSSEYRNSEDSFSEQLNSLNDLIDLYDKLHNSMVQYNASIISIYACFENFIDDMAKALVDFYFDNTLTFDELPQKIQENYFIRAGDFLSKPQQFSGLNKTPTDVINIIHKNITNQRDVSLQYEFLIKHSGNLKIDKVIELFNNLDVKDVNSKIKNNYIFKKYISENKEIKLEDVSTYLATATSIFFELDRVVDARNNVAHGWYEDSRISYQSILDDTIPFLQCLCRVILEEVVCFMFEYLLNHRKLQQFDNPINVFNKNILCINSKQSVLEVGDFLFYKNADNKYTVARIISLKKQDVSLDKNIEPNVDIGIGLDKPVKTSYEFYYFEQDL
ncbi:MAE_28990/MAE_18760 family HEPN-like nuclease [Anaerotignum sp.]|uniref:MAE_28990/MAE_18760 family HEPN-like nuclease n=1 Tax=Anaerotignum sp. TaxID=2039241 RepID=UPI0028AE7383|nr:MAE_28990/MAE_18760 family HEPN-like nuclease [Anaerotignum sp.]